MKWNIFGKGGVDYGSLAYSCLKKGGILLLGGRGRFWEGRKYMFKRRVYFGTEGGFRVCRIYRCLKGGKFWEVVGYYGSVAYIMAKEGVCSGRIGRFWESRISEEGYILGERGRF